MVDKQNDDDIQQLKNYSAQEIEVNMSIGQQRVGEARRKPDRYYRGAGGAVCLGAAMSGVLLLFGVLSGCAPEQQPNLGSTGSAQVNLNITMPQNVATVSTPQHSLWAKVQELVLGTEAWAATVNEIAALVVRVTGPGILSPVESRVTVTGATGGQTIPVTLEVPVGESRVFTVSARNIANQTIFQGQSAPLTLTAGEAATADVRLADTTIRITTTVLPDGTEDRSYTATLVAERASGAVTWTKQDGVLPPGVSLDGSTGALTGTPTSSGVFPITVRATDAAALFDEVRVTIRINPAPIPPKITTTTLPDGTVGNSYSTTLVATGGTSTPTWSVIAGALPPGLKLSASTGVITGTPTAESGANPFRFTVRATDTIPLTDEQALAIKINPAPVPPTITTTTLPDGTTEARYSARLAATGGTGEVTWSVVGGKLPDDLFLNRTTGAITGTPTKNGTFSFTIRATDTLPLSSQKALTIRIKEAPKPPVILTTTLPGGKVGDQYSAQLTATSTNGAVRWSSPDFPARFTLNGTTGAITGTPTTAGSLSFTVRATDSLNLFDEQTLLIQISDKPTSPVITTTSLPDGTVGASYSAKIEATGGAGTLAWSFIGGTLPPDVGFDGIIDSSGRTAGIVAGKPTKDGIYTFTVRASDTSSGLSDSQELSITIAPALTITTAKLPDAVSPTEYTFQLERSGGKSPYMWSIVEGGLPPDLALKDTGLISGKPTCDVTKVGPYGFTVQVKDSNGALAEKQLQLTLVFGCIN